MCISGKKQNIVLTIRKVNNLKPNNYYLFVFNTYVVKLGEVKQ